MAKTCRRVETKLCAVVGNKSVCIRQLHEKRYDSKYMKSVLFARGAINDKYMDRNKERY